MCVILTLALHFLQFAPDLRHCRPAGETSAATTRRLRAWANKNDQGIDTSLGVALGSPFGDRRRHLRHDGIFRRIHPGFLL